MCTYFYNTHNLKFFCFVFFFLSTFCNLQQYTAFKNFFILNENLILLHTRFQILLYTYDIFKIKIT